MFQGLLALLGRSLRIDSRSWQVHLARVGLLVGIYAAMVFSLATSARFGAPGLRFFKVIVWLDVAFMTLLGIGFFATTISEEKEEDTLGLMQMAGIHPLSILLGKVGGRLCQALLLIAVQYPFNLLAVTMGGVTPNQVRCAFVGLTAFMFLLAGLGLLCSTVAPRNRTAAALMILGLVIYLAVPYFAYEIYKFLVDRGLSSRTSTWVEVLWQTSSMCLFLQIPTILTSTFSASPWSIQAVSNIIAGAICFVAAWALFAVCTRNPTTESVTRGLLAHKKQRGTGWLMPGRPWANPLIWKDFYFTGGGLGMILMRFSFYLAVLIIAIALSEIWWGNRRWSGKYPFQDAIGLYQIFLLFLTTIEIALVVTRTLHDEIRGKTLATLVMLPTSLVAIVYSKLTGALLAALPGTCFLSIACLSTAGGRDNTLEFLEEGAGWFFLAHFLIVPHLSMVLALNMRWGCVPLAIGIGIGSMVGWVSVFESTRVRQNDGIVWMVALLLVTVCIACHFWIVHRLPKVAAAG